MKISKWVDMGQEVEIYISSDDIRLALAESFAAFTQSGEDAKVLGEGGPNRAELAMALNNIGAFLKAVTDEQIAMLTEKQRILIQDFLIQQGKRFQP